MADDTFSKTDLDYMEEVINEVNEEADMEEANREEANNNNNDINITVGNGVDTAHIATSSESQNTLMPPQKPAFVRSVSDSKLKVAQCAADKKNIPFERRKRARERWEKTIKGAMVASRFANILMNRRQTYVHVDSEGNVFFLIKLLFAMPQFSLIPLTLLINVYIIIFYNSAKVGVSLAFISFFQIFARSFDVLTDPLMAHISDNLTHTRFGRRIPYMMCCPLYAIAFFILVSPPLGQPSLATWWFGGSYLIFYFCDTLINVPFQALGPELTDDSDKRNELYMFVKLAEGVGIMIGTLTPSILVTVGLSETIIYQIIAGVFGSWYVISMYALIYNVKERPASTQEQQGKEVHQPFVTSMLRSMRNKAFKPLMVGWILDFASLAMFVTMIPFFLKYYMEVSDVHLGYAGATLFVSGFCAIPFFGYISRHDRKSDVWYEKIKIGKFNAWLTYNVINVCTNFLYLFIGEGDLYYMYFCMMMNGIPTGGQFLIASVLCDVIDYDEFLNFKRNEGQFSVFGTFVPKLVAIPCQSLPLVGMIVLGYVDPASVFDDTDDSEKEYFVPQNTKVKWFIRIFFVIVPLCFTSISFLIKRTFPINKAQMMQDIANGITKHLQGKSAIDPLTGNEVWIEELDDVQQYLSYLLDQFAHEQLLWLLSPDEIFKRHVQSGLPLRKNTLRHLTIANNNDNDENDNDNDEKETKTETNIDNNNGRKQSIFKKPNLSLCSGVFNCFKSEEELYPETMEAGDVKFGKNSKGEVVYVAISNYEAHGIDSGTRKLQRRMLFWVIFFVFVCVSCVAGVISTWHLLQQADYAFIPAIFCLCIGLSCTGAGFSFLRSQAAKEIREWVEKHKLNEDIIAKCIYPKTKGQRGGEILDDLTVNIIDKLVPRATADPNQLRSLRDVTSLINNNSMIDDDNKDLYN